MIRPDCCGIMWWNAARIPQNVDHTFQDTRSQDSSVSWAIGAWVGRAAGVVHEDVDTAEALDRAVDDGFDSFLGLHVGGDELGPSSPPSSDEALGPLLRRAAVHDDRGPSRKGPRDGEADPSVPPVTAATFPSSSMANPKGNRIGRGNLRPTPEYASAPWSPWPRPGAGWVEISHVAAGRRVQRRVGVAAECLRGDLRSPERSMSQSVQWVHQVPAWRSAEASHSSASGPGSGPAK